MRRKASALTAALIFLMVGSASRAQTSQNSTPASYQGEEVTAIDLAGRTDIDVAKLSSLLSQTVAAPYSQAKVDQSIAALKRTGQFKDVQVSVRAEPEGLRVVFLLQPALYFGMYQFTGIDGYSYARLLQVSNYSSEAPYSPLEVQAALTALTTYFQRDGYFQASVTSETSPDPGNGLVDVIFHANLGKHADFGAVSIEGPTAEETAHLQSVLKSMMARLHGSSIRSGKKYSLKTLQNATQYLERALVKQERLAAKVQLIGANYNPETNRADISFHVDSGPLVQVDVKGAHLWSWTKHRLLPVYQQNGLDTELVQEGRQNLVAHFQSDGYFDVKVDVQVEGNDQSQNILYTVDKGQRRKIVGIKVAGNQHVSEKELLQHAPVQKAHFITHGKYDAKSLKTLASVYQAAGYNNVRITPQFVRSGKNIVVTFQVEEGPRDTVASLKVAGNSTLTEEQFAPKGLKLIPGQPYSQKSINDDRDQIMSGYLELGYLTASLKETAEPVANDPHSYQVVYNITEGPQVRTSSIITIGKNHSVQKLIDTEIKTIEPEKPMTQQELMTSESRLYTLGVFDWAEIDPRRQITTQNQEDVVVKVHESRRNDLTYGVGFELVNRTTVPGGTIAVPGLPAIGLPSTFKTNESISWGPRIHMEYVRKNLFGKGESITVTGLAGPLDRFGSLTYTDPAFRWSRWKSSMTSSLDFNKQNPIFSANNAQFQWQFDRELGSKVNHVGARYSFSDITLSNLLIPGLIPVVDLHTRLSTLTATYSHDTRDNVLDAHKGFYQSNQFDLNPKFLGSSVSFAKFLSQFAIYRDIHKGTVWANSFRIGVEEPFANSHVPISQEFFTGGGSTLRGFPLNGAGPQQTIPACGNPNDKSTCAFITVPTGGRQLAILNSELRIPTPIKQGLSTVLFYDGGNVYDHVGFRDLRSGYTNSVGLGFRYSTPVGPVRVDLGHLLNNIPGIKSTQIFITLGQAF